MIVKEPEQLEPPANSRAGSLELRLRPTMTSDSAAMGPPLMKKKPASMHGGESRFRLFNKPSTSSRASSSRNLSKKPSMESISSALNGRPTVNRSSTNNSNVDSVTSGDSKVKRFTLHRNTSKKTQEKPSDDLTKMMTRASNYMTLAYVKIPSVVLCLSYKGKGERNIEDVHDFVFRLPMIEYRNKTWSNLDLALALKKDVIRALISHMGAIIGNKFSKHRPNPAQQNRLRELATSSMLLAPSSNDNSYENSDASSTFATSPTDTKGSEPRRSFASSTGKRRPGSASSSVNSLQSMGGRSQSLMMTPSNNNDATSESIADSELGSTESFDNNGLEEQESKSSGFMANTINRLKKKDRDTSSLHVEEDDNSSKKKGKLMLGKKILSSLGDH